MIPVWENAIRRKKRFKASVRVCVIFLIIHDSMKFHKTNGKIKTFSAVGQQILHFEKCTCDIQHHWHDAHCVQNVKSSNKVTFYDTPKLFTVDSDSKCHAESGSPWCPRGIIRHFPKSKMASKTAVENAEIHQIVSLFVFFKFWL